MPTPTLLRYRQTRKADNLDDQKSATEIVSSETVSVTQEDLQEYILSQIKRIIFRDDPGHWYLDFGEGGTGIRGLKQLHEDLLTFRASP